LIIMSAGFPALLCYFLLEQVEYKVRGGEVPGVEAWYASRWRVLVYAASRPLFKDKLLCILSFFITHEAFLEDPVHRNAWPPLPLLYNHIDPLLKGTMFILIPVYFIPRLYLVVECFIQLFHLPPGPVFTEPSWSSYFPHIG